MHKSRRDKDDDDDDEKGKDAVVINETVAEHCNVAYIIAVSSFGGDRMLLTFV